VTFTPPVFGFLTILQVKQIHYTDILV